jgi:hypothetical protein
MEIILAILYLSVGAAIGAVTMALLVASKYADVLDDMYTKGVEDGRRLERDDWLRASK